MLDNNTLEYEILDPNMQVRNKSSFCWGNISSPLKTYISRK